MDIPVIRDNSDESASSASTVPTGAHAEPVAAERGARRFAFDPTSSPVLVAALAWDTAVAR